MRQPKSFQDIGVLEDEPFRTEFPRIKEQLEATRGSRSQQRTFRKVAGQHMVKLIVDRDCMNAAASWIKLAFVSGPWDTEAIQPSLEDSESLLIFAEFYFYLSCREVDAARNLLFSERKRRGYHGYPDGSIFSSYHPLSPSRDVVSSTADGYEAGPEDEISGDEGVVPASPHRMAPARERFLPTIPCTDSLDCAVSLPVEVAPSECRKRKAIGEHPSSSSSSSPSDKDNYAPLTHPNIRIEPADLLSDLTSLSESESALSSPLLEAEAPLSKSISSKRRAKSRAKQFKTPSKTRNVPTRLATNHEALIAMARADREYHERKGKDRDLDDGDVLFPHLFGSSGKTSVTQGNGRYHQEEKVVKKAKRQGTHSRRKLQKNDSSTSQAAQSISVNQRTIVSPVQEAARVSTPARQRSSVTRNNSRPSSNNAKLRRKQPSGKQQKKRLDDTSDVVKQPAKKRRGKRGPIVEEPPAILSQTADDLTASQKKTRASTRAQTSRCVAPTITIPSPSVRNNAESRPPTVQSGKAFTSEVEAPLVSHQSRVPKKKCRKRSFAEVDSVSTSPSESPQVLATQPKHRAKAPLPKKRKNQKMGRLPLPGVTAKAPSNIPQRLADVDSIVCATGAEGIVNLRCVVGSSQHAIEWDGVHLPANQIPDESSDDDLSSSQEVEKRNTRHASTGRRAANVGRGRGTSAHVFGNPMESIPAADERLRDVVARNSPTIEQGSRETAQAATATSTECVNALTTVPVEIHPVQTSETAARLRLPILPPIWAESRQEVCESFDWFRSYQGGVYFIKEMAKGYLLSAFSASRDIFHHNGKFIISHGGGKAESVHKSNGHFETHKDSDQQADDKSVRSLLKTYELGRPIALVIDDKYALFPFDLSSRGCTYAILGYYRISHAWAERQYSASASEYVVRYKFAFQWCEEQGEPWWTPTLGPSDAPGAEPALISNISRQCTSCLGNSPQVYAEGWMCLRPSCQLFWKLDGVGLPVSLHYSSAFLKLLLFPKQELEDIRPPLPTLNAPDDGILTTFHFMKGWHCRECGRLSCRFKWEHWQCRYCANVFQVEGRIRTAREFMHQLEAKRFSRYFVSPQSGKNTLTCIVKPFNQIYRFDGGYSTFVTFILPSVRGRIHVIFSSPHANQKADQILKDYQEEAANGTLKFRRWPLRAHKCRGTLLTNYFSQNTGEPYQYVGGTDNTVPWENAPTAVVNARELIKERMKQALQLDGEFNEVLSAAYMDTQKMAFHSDAERGLGPTVASLSLGAAAYMHFRLHAQYAAELQDPSKRDVLSLFLRHGDVVVMQGADVQKYYEHAVIPLNFRVAATARYIDSSRHY